MGTKNASSEITELLKSVSYFESLDPATLKLVGQLAIPRKYGPEQVVFIEGEPCPGLYIVGSGWLKAVKISMDGREQVLHRLGAGETFNAISVFTGALNQATVTALEESVVWLVPRDQMLRLLQENPSLAQNVIQDLAGRVLHLIRMVEDLSLHTVEVRLARLLLDQEVNGIVKRRSWATQAEMASRLGTVPDVLNRALRKLAEQNLIHVSRNQIEIMEVEKLREVAQIIE